MSSLDYNDAAQLARRIVINLSFFLMRFSLWTVLIRTSLTVLSGASCSRTFRQGKDRIEIYLNISSIHSNSINDKQREWIKFCSLINNCTVSPAPVDTGMLINNVKRHYIGLSLRMLVGIYLTGRRAFASLHYKSMTDMIAAIAVRIPIIEH